jgi:predicted  nucleic acid-binding Zn-ribbon protein
MRLFRMAPLVDSTEIRERVRRLELMHVRLGTMHERLTLATEEVQAQARQVQHDVQQTLARLDKPQGGAVT